MDPDRLDALLADAVAEHTGRERAAERMLRQAAEEGATFVGTLVELAERREPVTVRTTSGHSHRGVVVAVGRDFAVLRDGEKPPTFLATAFVASVRTGRASRHDTASDRPAPIDASLAAVLSGLAGERPTVHVAVPGHDAPTLGELRALGHDVLTLLVDAASRPTLYIPIASIETITILDL